MKESDYTRKGLLTLISSMIFATLTIVDASLTDAISYNKAWAVFKDNLVMLLIAAMLAPCFKGLFVNHADDSITLDIVIVIALFMFSYDYESVFRKPEKEPLGRPLMKDAGFSVFLLNIVTVMLCSRLPHLFQSANLIVMSLM